MGDLKWDNQKLRGKPGKYSTQLRSKGERKSVFKKEGTISSVISAEGIKIIEIETYTLDLTTE